MTGPRISLVVEGTESENGDVRLEVFLAELQRLQDALKILDATAGGGERNSYFAVVGLSHSSPATVELELRVRRRRNVRDVRSQVLDHFQRAVRSVEAGQIPDDVDYALLENLRDIAAPVGRELRAVSIRFDGETFNLTQQFAGIAEQQLADSETCLTTIEGMLERINVHASANVFHIYPDVGPKSLRCEFPVALEDTALAAIKRRVAVSGNAEYRRKAPFPHLIRVTDIEIYRPEGELAEFDLLKGIAPNATGELLAADFVRDRRNDWQ